MRSGLFCVLEERSRKIAADAAFLSLDQSLWSRPFFAHPILSEDSLPIKMPSENDVEAATRVVVVTEEPVSEEAPRSAIIVLFLILLMSEKPKNNYIGLIPLKHFCSSQHPDSFLQPVSSCLLWPVLDGGRHLHVRGLLHLHGEDPRHGERQ